VHAHTHTHAPIIREALEYFARGVVGLSALLGRHDLYELGAKLPQMIKKTLYFFLLTTQADVQVQIAHVGHVLQQSLHRLQLKLTATHVERLQTADELTRA